MPVPYDPTWNKHEHFINSGEQYKGKVSKGEL
jgi:hypothetical protein